MLADKDASCNDSRFAQPLPSMPGVGGSVRLFLDAKGYIRDVERVPYAADGVDVPAPEEPSRQIEQQVRTVRSWILLTVTSALRA
jgi:hypothetical protein